MWKKCCAVLVLLAGLSPSLRGQLPGVAPAAPGGALVPVAPAAIAPAAVAPTAPAAPGFLARLHASCAACREKLCASPLGQLLNNGLKPAGAFSGGIVPPLCPPNAVSAADLAKPSDSAGGAAARIKADEAAAKQRRADVRYLGTVDCHYWPEAQAGLINALRADRNECVRLEAAWALARGCCCSKSTLAALTITVSGSTEDDNPSETSERVKAAAAVALGSCVGRVSEEPPVAGELPQPELLPERPERERKDAPVLPNPERKDTPQTKGTPTAPKGAAPAVRAAGDPPTYYQRVEKMPMRQVMIGARRALEKTGRVVPATASAQSDRTSVVGIIRNAMAPPTSPGVAGTSPVPYEPMRVDGRAAGSPPAAVTGAVYHQFPGPNQNAAAEVPFHAWPVAPVTQSPYAQPALPYNQVPVPQPGPQGAVATDVAQLLAVLQNDVRPEHRETAAGGLATADWRTNPQIVQVLLTFAHRDPAPLVRVSCIRSLSRMNANTLPVVTALHDLKADADPRVQREAERALARFLPGQPAPIEPLVQHAVSINRPR